MTSPKNTMKELYHEMKKRIRIVIKLLGKLNSDKPNPMPDDNSFQTISNLIHNILITAQLEPENQYRESIVTLSNWLDSAFKKEYLNKNNMAHPNPLFVIKKGAEILHSFFHRDLRRKQLSTEEHEIYRSFLQLIQNLPDPTQESSDQNNVNNRIDDLLKSS